MSLNRSYIALGSNIGESEQYLCSAVEYIAQDIELIALSSIYETEPWGLTGQPNFFNAVISVDYNSNPNNLLKALQDIENHFKRERKSHWSLRTIDLDILLFGERVMDEPDLKIPHRYLEMRDFFLIPLLEIAPDISNPITGIKYSEYLRRLPSQLETIVARKEVHQWQDTITSLSRAR